MATSSPLLQRVQTLSYKVLTMLSLWSLLQQLPRITHPISHLCQLISRLLLLLQLVTVHCKPSKPQPVQQHSQLQSALQPQWLSRIHHKLQMFMTLIHGWDNVRQMEPLVQQLELSLHIFSQMDPLYQTGYQIKEVDLWMLRQLMEAWCHPTLGTSELLGHQLMEQLQ